MGMLTSWTSWSDEPGRILGVHLWKSESPQSGQQFAKDLEGDLGPIGVCA